MDFSSLSASRIDNKSNCLGRSSLRPRKGRSHQATKEMFDALFSTVEGDVGDLSENLMNANVSFAELASLTNRDLELIGCKDATQRSSLLEFFKMMPKQEPSFKELIQSEEAQKYNETILQRTTNHLDAMRASLAAANYKLKFNPSEDVIIGEKNFASRFVLDALEELQRVTVEIDSQLDALTILNEKTPKPQKYKQFLTVLKFSIWISFGSCAGFWIWKVVKSR